jgi:signal transduction histidine kinase
MATPGHLEEVLDNLISNALRASPPKTAVRIDAAAKDDQVELHVVDQGPGMTAEERARAFDRFWRAPRNRQQPGSGLGLAISKRLMAADGGDVDLREAPEGGTDAVIRLQRA